MHKKLVGQDDCAAQSAFGNNSAHLGGNFLLNELLLLEWSFLREFYFNGGNCSFLSGISLRRLDAGGIQISTCGLLFFYSRFKTHGL